MEQKQTDKNLERKIQEAFQTTIPETEVLDKKLQEAYEQIQNAKRKKKPRLPLAVKCSTAAAVLLLAMVYCVKNPAWAAKLPFIGDIFNQLQEQVPYPGDYSSSSITLPDVKKEQKDGSPAQTDAADQDGSAKRADAADKNNTEKRADAIDQDGTTNHADASEQNNTAKRADAADPSDTANGANRITCDGVTVTLSEVSFDNKAMYLALLVQNEKGFAQNLFDELELGFECWVTMYKKDGSKEEFNDVDGTYLAYHAQGEYLDAHTFRGLAQFTNTKLDLSKYTSCEITFTDFWQRLTTGKEKKANIPVTGEEVTIVDHDIVHFKGNWSFQLDVNLTKDAAQEVIIREANDQGVGIEKVVKTKYEIYAVPILPEGANEYDYFITMWDAHGKPLDDHGHSGVLRTDEEIVAQARRKLDHESSLQTRTGH